MQRSAVITFQIDQLIPNAGENESGWIVSVWEGANGFLQNLEFSCEDPYRSALAEYRISARLDAAVKLLQQARSKAGSFAGYLQQSQQGSSLSTGAAITIEIQAAKGNLELYSMYNAVGTFIHQLVLAFNLAFPGSCRFVGTHYEGPDAVRFEAPQFESALFTNGWLSAFDADWPTLKPLHFRQVWQWLTARGTSETDVAVAEINKVLFGLLEIAQHRHAVTARDAILVAHLIEILLKVNDGNVPLIRERVVAVLGPFSKRADSFNELYRLKDRLLRGDYPARRPALIVHEADDPILQQLEMHNSPVEQGAAIVLALLQDLINHDAADYVFTQQVSRA